MQQQLIYCYIFLIRLVLLLLFWQQIWYIAPHLTYQKVQQYEQQKMPWEQFSEHQKMQYK